MSWDFEGVAECIAETKLSIIVRVNGQKYAIPRTQLHEDSEVYAKGHRGKLIISDWWAETAGHDRGKAKPLEERASPAFRAQRCSCGSSGVVQCAAPLRGAKQGQQCGRWCCADCVDTSQKEKLCPPHARVLAKREPYDPTGLSR